MKRNKIYCSVSCFIAENWHDVFSQVRLLQVQGLELSFFRGLSFDLEACLADEKKIEVLAHNFFDSNDDSLVINLSDPNPVACKRSYDFVVEKLRWCAKHEIKRYTFHAGFAGSVTSAHLGGPMPQHIWTDIQKAKDAFIINMRAICCLAQKLGVEVAFENHILIKENLLADGSYGFLCVSPVDILQMLEAINMPNLKLLLDVGHLKVSAKTLGFSFEEALAKLVPYASQIHLHDNNGLTDAHALPTNELLAMLSHLTIPEHVDIVLEVTRQPLETLEGFLCRFRAL